MHFRIAERHALELGPDLRCRSGLFFEEPAPGRHVVEKVAHEKLRPHGTRHGVLSGERTAVDERFGSRLVALLARAQLHLRHGGDRGQRLAAESERMQRVDVVHRGDLARGVAVERHAGVDGRHAASVVHDLNQVLAAVAEVHLDRAGSGVDGILHHLLDHRRGAVHHLARGDLVRHHFGQQSDLVGHGLLLLVIVGHYHQRSVGVESVRALLHRSGSPARPEEHLGQTRK